MHVKLGPFDTQAWSVRYALNPFQKWQNPTVLIDNRTWWSLILKQTSEVDEDTPSEDGFSESDMFNFQSEATAPFRAIWFLQTIIFEDNNQGALG
ncbi:hypothetical protein JCGZ_04929 [Jatropha curcas]|uniref:Uncharacterized protein n=1 Tax=Jatropha curcas TaxID=180498 RepID=A0A067L5L0_JATCU|nr:hypothetical protein JCGZ_04929 [Jatropha curcas]